MSKTHCIPVAAAALFATASIVAAQEAAAPNPPTIPVIIRTYKVKPGMVAPFEEIMRKHRDAYEKAGRQFFMVWRAFFGDPYSFTVMYDVPGLEALDGPNPVSRAYGERESVLMAMNLAQYIDGAETRMWHLHQELSVVTADKFNYAAATFIGTRNMSAHREDSIDQRKVIDAHRTKVGTNLWTLHLDYGGDDYLTLSVAPVEKMADLRNLPTLTKVLGAEEAKRISAAREQRRTSRHPYVWQYRSAVSFRRANAGTSSPANQ